MKAATPPQSPVMLLSICVGGQLLRPYSLTMHGASGVSGSLLARWVHQVLVGLHRETPLRGDIAIYAVAGLTGVAFEIRGTLPPGWVDAPDVEVLNGMLAGKG